MNLHQKLVEIRKAVPCLEKDTTGYQYKYVSCSSVLEKIVPKMNELGVLLVPSVSDIQTNLEKKATVSCKMVMTWIDSENPEDSMDVPFACFGTQDDISKAFGSALTYSERYFLLKFFNVATDVDDPDAYQKKAETKAVDNGYENSSNYTDEEVMRLGLPHQMKKFKGWTLGNILLDKKGGETFFESLMEKTKDDNFRLILERALEIHREKLENLEVTK